MNHELCKEHSNQISNLSLKFASIEAKIEGNTKLTQKVISLIDGNSKFQQKIILYGLALLGSIILGVLGIKFIPGLI